MSAEADAPQRARRKRAAFTQADLVRAFRAAHKAGVEARVEVDALTGNLIVSSLGVAGGARSEADELEARMRRAFGE